MQKNHNGHHEHNEKQRTTSKRSLSDLSDVFLRVLRVLRGSELRKELDPVFANNTPQQNFGDERKRRAATMQMRRFGFRLAMLGVVLAALNGCTGKTEETTTTTGGTTPAQTTAAPKEEKLIGVSVLTIENPFFKIMGEAMEAEGKKHGFKVLLQSGDKDAAKQKDQVNDFIAQKVSAIVLCPCDSRSVGTAIQAANEASIPVFTADIASLDKSAKVVSHIATDNYEGGKLAGKAMIEALGGKGNVAIIDFPEVESVIQRTKGFREVIAGAPGIKIVAQLPGGALRDTAYKTAQDILEKHAQLDGIFCINDPTAFGAIGAIEKAGRQGKIKIISFDGQLEAKQAVKDGKIYAEPIQYPEKIGQMTIQAIVKHMEGETVPPETLIPTTLYGKAEADADPLLAKAK
jgi:ribose transport system substrate-binding protein